MKKKQKSLLLTFSILIMIFSLYIGSGLFNRFKIDFTQGKLYTLTDGTKNILKNLQKPLKLKLYYSKTAANKTHEGIRSFNNYFLYVQSVLEEYVSHSNGKLRLMVIDPRPDSDDESDAMKYGLKRFQVTQTENYFFGLVVENNTGAEKTIDFFDPANQEMLEYDLTKTLYSATDPNKKTIGILAGETGMIQEDISPYMMQMMQMQGKSPPQSWIVVQMMKEFYEVKQITNEVKALPDMDIMLVVHPKSIPDRMQFLIDQYVLKGGKLMLMVDPHFLGPAAGNPMGMSVNSSNIKRLLRNWGIDFNPSQFAGDRNLAGMGRTSQFAPPSKILPILLCNGGNCTKNLTDPISKSLNNLAFFYPGALKVSKSGEQNKEVTYTPLIQTTNKGNTYSASNSEIMRPDSLYNKIVEGDRPVNIAMKIQGKFVSAFPNGAEVPLEIIEEGTGKKPVNPEMEKLTGLKKSEKQTAIIIFADVNFINDQFAFKRSMLGLAKSNDNSSLFLNSLENLTGNEDLMSIRSKGTFTRPFDIIQGIEMRAEERTANKVIQINSSIQKFSTELKSLGEQANEGNIALLQNKSLEKRRQLNSKLAMLKKELRQVKREGREEIEILGAYLQYFNTLFVPFFVIIFAFFYQRKRLRNLTTHL